MKLHLYVLNSHTSTGVRSLRLREHPQDVTRSAFKRLRDFLKVSVCLAYDNTANPCWDNTCWCSAAEMTRKPCLRMTGQAGAQTRSPA